MWQVAEERKASGSLASELSQARAALQKAQTDVIRHRCDPLVSLTLYAPAWQLAAKLQMLLSVSVWPLLAPVTACA